MLFQIILKNGDLVHVLAHSGCRRPHLLKSLISLSELFICLLNLVFKYHQPPIISYHLLGCAYFFSCSNFLVKLSASLWSLWASDSKTIKFYPEPLMLNLELDIIFCNKNLKIRSSSSLLTVMIMKLIYEKFNS
jgi:hypothetical protein